jgi:hypothetical protein
MALEKKQGPAMAKWIKVGIELNERACQLGNDASCRALVQVEQAFSTGK